MSDTLQAAKDMTPLELAALEYEASMHCARCNGIGEVLILGDWRMCTRCNGKVAVINDPVAHELIMQQAAALRERDAELAAARAALSTARDKLVEYAQADQEANDMYSEGVHWHPFEFIAPTLEVIDKALAATAQADDAAGGG